MSRMKRKLEEILISLEYEKRIEFLMEECDMSKEEATEVASLYE